MMCAYEDVVCCGYGDRPRSHHRGLSCPTVGPGLPALVCSVCAPRDDPGDVRTQPVQPSCEEAMDRPCLQCEPLGATL